ncbi:tyrosine-type recombinase/integrase [Prevotella sp.]|uniref:tyrosine-type recombinase/integrase n=1 Tax=Prevotella sp. TaxID=59823 RepID=UPI0027E3192A|nr:tyrosine-type recombinase/integrase [Prevotella sp.]
MLDHLKKGEREKIATVLITKISNLLMAGWNPFANNETSRSFTEWEVVVERYNDYTKAAEKKGILKNKTAVDYRSRMSGLLSYIEEANVRIKYVNQFDKILVVDFLDYILLDKERSPKTRNNYRTWLSTFAAWLVDRQYIQENFVEKIKMIKENEKFRDPMTPEHLRALGEYTKENCPEFHLACLMEYYTFIRPEELRHIKIGYISIKDQTVTIPAEVAKNRRQQTVALNDTILKTMIEQDVFKYTSQDYLFGKDLKPGGQQIAINRFRQEWVKVRKALSFPNSYQFYSLKDSGIRDLANAEGIVAARDQARHSDISVTNHYLKHTNVVNEKTKHFTGEL